MFMNTLHCLKTDVRAKHGLYQSAGSPGFYHSADLYENRGWHMESKGKKFSFSLNIFIFHICANLTRHLRQWERS
jgi:hypothetical protein